MLQLAVVLAAALNSNKIIGGTYRVVYVSETNHFTVDIQNPSAADVCRIWQEAHLKANAADWTTLVPGITANDLHSANRACGFLDGTFLITTYSAPSASTLGTALGAPDVQPYKQLFLRSNLASGSSQSLGVNGESDIIRRIDCGNTPQNAMIHDVHSTPNDSVQIAGTPEFSQMWFQLIDVEGQIVDTHGHPISFSIILQDIEE